MSSTTLQLVNSDLLVRESAAPFRLGYRPALDGLRGIAILAVLAFHTHHIFNWSILNGGNVGVDIFFVLSGFLITVLLIEEWQGNGRISLKGFYWRRVLRLVPALVILLVILYLFANVFLSATEAADTRRGIPIAFFYASDFALAFLQLRLGALQHTWSLAIEEHFYLVWPLFLVAALKLGASRKQLVVITLTLAVASAVYRAVLHQLGALPVRTYYGIDTRADALLIGCATGMCMCWGFFRARSFRLWVVPAVLSIITMMFATSYATPFMHLGGFTLLAMASAAVIVWVMLAPTSYLRRFLEFGPLVWVGRISYGLYLWHYPIFKGGSLLRVGWPLQLLIALTATFAVTSLSYYLIERPTLRLKVRRLVTLT
ncbi:MAG TPA: acyltransferase [Pyrinomonadaceae bacterium]|jgi:peptidoglycan/LPS O-acetylase OafA/YrhL|nr:acyltransferase [Pyrinomonadaceae bacterium]